MQFFTGISRNTQYKSYMLSLTECVRDFQNNALWDTHCHALLLQKLTNFDFVDSHCKYILGNPLRV